MEMKMKIVKVNEHNVYEGAVFKVNKKTFEREDGSTFCREIVESSEVVHVLPFDKNYNIYAISEFRGTVEDYILGFPAGKIDSGETPEDAVKREIEEEIGMKVVDLIPIHKNLVTTMGICNEVGHYFLALVEEFKDGERKHFQEPDENIEIKKMNMNEFVDKLMVLLENGKPFGLKCAFLWMMFVTMMNAKKL